LLLLLLLLVEVMEEDEEEEPEEEEGFERVEVEVDEVRVEEEFDGMRLIDLSEPLLLLMLLLLLLFPLPLPLPLPDRGCEVLSDSESSEGYCPVARIGLSSQELTRFDDVELLVVVLLELLGL
jgi:hypothetical protein